MTVHLYFLFLFPFSTYPFIFQTVSSEMLLYFIYYYTITLLFHFFFLTTYFTRHVLALRCGEGAKPEINLSLSKWSHWMPRWKVVQLATLLWSPCNCEELPNTDELYSQVKQLPSWWTRSSNMPHTSDIKVEPCPQKGRVPLLVELQTFQIQTCYTSSAM